MTTSDADPAAVPSPDYTATLPRKRMGSGVLFRDSENRVLLVEPVYKDEWELPGGEELGLVLSPGPSWSSTGCRHIRRSELWARHATRDEVSRHSSALPRCRPQQH